MGALTTLARMLPFDWCALHPFARPCQRAELGRCFWRADAHPQRVPSPTRCEAEAVATATGGGQQFIICIDETHSYPLRNRHHWSAAAARPRAAAAHRSRLSAGFRADLRRLVALAEEMGAYSVKLGSVTVTLRLRQDALHGSRHGSGAAAARVAADEGRPVEPLADGGAQPDAPTPARPDNHLPQGQPLLNSKQQRSRARAAAWHTARAGVADMQALRRSR